MRLYKVVTYSPFMAGVKHEKLTVQRNTVDQIVLARISKIRRTRKETVSGWIVTR